MARSWSETDFPNEEENTYNKVMNKLHDIFFAAIITVRVWLIERFRKRKKDDGFCGNRFKFLIWYLKF